MQQLSVAKIASRRSVTHSLLTPCSPLLKQFSQRHGCLLHFVTGRWRV